MTEVDDTATRRDDNYMPTTSQEPTMTIDTTPEHACGRDCLTVHTYADRIAVGMPVVTPGCSADVTSIDGDTATVVDSLGRTATWPLSTLTPASFAESCVHADPERPTIAGVLGWVTTGGCQNRTCIRAVELGRPWHATPRGGSGALQTYHYATRDEAVQAIRSLS